MNFVDLPVSSSYVLILNTNGEERVVSINEGHICFHSQWKLLFEICFLHVIDKKGTFY